MNLVVLSRNSLLYSTQSLVDAAKARNHQVRVIDHMHCDIFIEKNDPKIFYHGEEINDIDAIIPRIGSSATSYGASVIRQFEAMGAFSTLRAEPLLQSRNKLSCLQLLASKGIGVPKTAISNNLMTIGQSLDRLGNAPYIVKLAQGTQGLGVILSESKANAEAIIEAFYKTEEKVLMQQFIEEAKGCDVRVFIVDQKIVGVMKRQAKPGEFRSNLHRGAQSYVINLTEEEKFTALKAAEVMGLSIAGVDMLQTAQGPLILEVNASPGLEGIEGTTQVDIATKIVQFVEKNVKND